MRVPKLCRHKGSGLAYVTDPRTKGEVYFGRAGTAEAEAAYRRWLAGYLSHPAAAAPSGGRVSVAELWERYLDHAATYYRKDGEPTSSPEVLRATAAYCEALYDLPADEMRPGRLREVRRAMLDAGLARSTANVYVGAIRRCWRWAVGEELVPAAVLEGLRAVPDLAPGRGGRETRAVGPADPAAVAAVLPLLPWRTRQLVLVQRAGGMRPGEAVRLRPRDLDRTSTPWLYQPHRHKKEHLGEPRRIWLGPAARDALALLLAGDPDPDAYLFRGRRQGTHLTVCGYRQSVSDACAAADVARFTPNQLRHSRGTELRKLYGIETAQAVLGHDDPQTTLTYAQRLEDLARIAAEESG
jgi:integrase